ncbi:MAG: hypothetical protein JZU49_02545, partial [Sulfuricurvum sp.]|nr:hypothetical protein [Sulfuricurvum sp.]
LTLLFAINLFATCSNIVVLPRLVPNSTNFNNGGAVCSATVGNYAYNGYAAGGTSQVLGTSSFNTSTTAQQWYITSASYSGKIYMNGNYQVICQGYGIPVTSNICPSGQIYDSVSCACKKNTCSWVTTPPWFSTSRPQSECNNYIKGYDSSILDDTMYLFNHSWCSTDTTCYAKRYYCPAGQNYDYQSSTCKTPTKPAPSPYCPSGYYPTAVKQISSSDGGDICGQTWICKNNPAITLERTFSCGAGPVDSSPPDSNPPVYDTDSTPSAQPYKDGASACNAKQTMAQIMCASPSVLSFSCDPTTGAVTKSECKAPIIPPKDDPLAGDSTKGATTEDIKKLGNSLPTS